MLRDPLTGPHDIELLPLMVKHGTMLLHSFYKFLSSVTPKALANFDSRHEFIVELFRAGARFQLLVRCCCCCFNVAPCL